LLRASCTTSTWKQYEAAFKKFELFCNNVKHDPRNPNINIIVSFLTELFEKGSSYTTINTARSALSTILGHVEGLAIGSHPLIMRLLKGVSRLRPPTCKYDTVWDPQLVLSYIPTMGENNVLSLRDLGAKLAALMALCSGQRVQTLASIKTPEIHFRTDGVIINISNRLKTSKPGSGTSLSFPRYGDKNLCLVNTLEEYLLRTTCLKQHDSLFTQSKLPHKPACSQTISKWLKEILHKSGVSIQEFSSHSFRHASTSKALKVGVSVDTIFQAAGWSNNSKMFARFYNKPITDSFQFANAILSSNR